MTECFQAADGISLVIRWQQMQFAAAMFDQAWLARDGKFFFIWRANNAYLRKLKSTHCAETSSADPRQTAWR